MLVDSSRLHTQSYEDMLRQAHEAGTWLVEQGVRVNATRYALHLKEIRQWLKSPVGYKFQPDKCKEHLWRLAEVEDVLQISTWLKQISDRRFLQTLKNITSGTELLADEGTTGGSIHGRNAAFELFTAARIARAGIPVTFHTDADITAIVGGQHVAIECKRVLVAESMEDRIKDAHSQIKRRIKAGEAARGIIAISVSRLVHDVFMGEGFGIAADPPTLAGEARQMLERWGDVCLERFSGLSDEVAAIIFQYKMPFLDENTYAPVFLSRFAHFPLSHGRNAENDAINLGMREALASSVRGGPAAAKQ